MNLGLIQFGKTKDRWLQEGIDEYLKRLEPWHRVQIIQLPDASIKNNPDTQAVMQKEAEAALKVIQADDYVIVLDEAGKQYNSLDFSAFLTNLSERRRVLFVIGGVFGVCESLKARADELMSLSSLTFTHRMARLVLIEQIYRACMIRSGRKYHI